MFQANQLLPPARHQHGATDGWAGRVRSLSASKDTALTSVRVVAPAARGAGSKSESSPNMSGGPMIASRWSRPSGDGGRS